MTNRPPAVAGMFYPGDPGVLQTDVLRLLNEAVEPADSARPAPKALIVPHAGYPYSGEIAARAYARLVPHADRYRRVVLLGPAHRVYLDGLAVPDCDAFAFPGGEVALDMDALAAMRNLPGVSVSDAAHAGEHCLEVQLPFLHAILQSYLLVPFVVGRCPPSMLANVLRQLWGGTETLIVVSSDLSHFLDYDEAVATDRHTAAAIAARSTTLDGHEACGAHAINGLMSIAAATGLSVETIEVRNSGDTAGDRQRVVGYGAFALY